jgi:putative transposase
MVESFIGRFRDECLNEEVFASLAEARAVIERWRLDYKHASRHPSVYAIEEKRFC